MTDTTNMNFADQCSINRTQIKSVGECVKLLKNMEDIPDAPGIDKGEMAANVMLAYRHLEDAAMRLGKAIQAFEGGKSIYDTNDAKRVAANGPVPPGAYANGTGGSVNSDTGSGVTGE